MQRETIRIEREMKERVEKDTIRRTSCSCAERKFSNSFACCSLKMLKLFREQTMTTEIQ